MSFQCETFCLFIRWNITWDGTSAIGANFLCIFYCWVGSLWQLSPIFFCFWAEKGLSYGAHLCEVMPKSPAVFRTSSELQEVRHASFKLVFYLSRKRSLSFNYHSGVGSRFLSIVQKTVVVTSATAASERKCCCLLQAPHQPSHFWLVKFSAHSFRNCIHVCQWTSSMECACFQPCYDCSILMLLG